jgi:hypothetical protein
MERIYKRNFHILGFSTLIYHHAYFRFKKSVHKFSTGLIVYVTNMKILMK